MLRPRRLPAIRAGWADRAAREGTGPPSLHRPSYRRYVSQVVVIVADMAQSRAAGSAVELWRGRAQMTSTMKDLTVLAPVLVEAAFRHFGETTPREVRHLFTEEEARALQH